MSILSREMRSELAADFPQGNPLVIIGVSAQVLDLGLSADELFDYIARDVARRLVLRFHTDRGGFTTSEDVASLRGRLAEAYRLLQERETFDKAMAEFRNLKSEERAEMRVLRQALDVAQQRADSYANREKTVSDQARQLDQSLQVLEKNKQAQRLIVPDLEGRLERQARSLDSRETSLRRYRRLHRGAMRYMGFLTGDKTKDMPYPHALEARWLAVASLVPATYSERAPKATGSKGKWTKGFYEATASLRIPEQELEQVRSEWLSRLPGLSTPLETEPRWTYGVRLHVLDLSTGKPKVVFGWPQAIYGRIVGSVPPHPSPFGRSDLITKMPEDAVVENLLPFLIPGALLISGSVRRLVEDREDGRQFPVCIRDTKHLVLGAG